MVYIMALIAMIGLLYRCNHLFQLGGYKYTAISNMLKLTFTRIIIFVIFAILIVIFGLCKYQLLATIFIIILSIIGISISVKDIIKKYKIRLKLTPRMIRLMITQAIISLGIVLLCLGIKMPFVLAIAIVIIPFIALLGNLINSPIEHWVKQKFINNALKKLNEINPIIIGVTGSFGKTSVKSIVGVILSKKYKTYITPLNYNTPMGITKSISMMPNDTEIFIVEMGARKKGDIAELCEIVKPTIGIITGINNQHLESFGNIKNTIATKCELAEYVAKNNGLMYVNADTAKLEELLASIKGKVAITSTELVRIIEAQRLRKDIFMTTYATDIKVGLIGAMYSIEVIREDKSRVRIDECQHILLGKHNVSNALLGVSLAISMGIDIEDIKLALEELRQIDNRLKVTTSGDITILDDSYNCNYDGFLASLDVLKNAVGRKIVATSGIVELKSDKALVNTLVGEKLALIADRVLIVSKVNREHILKGLHNNNYSDDKIIICDTLSDVMKYFASNVSSGDTVLLHSDLPDNYK